MDVSEERSDKRPKRAASLIPKSKIEQPKKQPKRATVMPKTKGRIAKLDSRTPMSKSEYMYPKIMPAKLPRQRLLKDLFLRPKPPPLEDFDEDDMYSLKKFIPTEAKEALNQGDYDSCWAISVEQQIEYNAHFHGEVELQDWKLSSQCLIDCLPAIYNGKHLEKWYAEGECYPCNMEDALHLVKYRGMALATDVPYEGPYRGFRPYSSVGFIEDYFMIPLGWSDPVIASAMKDLGFLVGTFSCDNSINDYPKNTVYKLPQKKKVKCKHCALITGVGRYLGVSCYEIRNTFGPSWGNNGYGFIDKDLFTVIEGIIGASITTLDAYMRSGVLEGFRSLME